MCVPRVMEARQGTSSIPWDFFKFSKSALGAVNLIENPHLDDIEGNLDLERQQSSSGGRAGALAGLHEPVNNPAKSCEVPPEGFRAGDRPRYQNSAA